MALVSLRQLLDLAAQVAGDWNAFFDHSGIPPVFHHRNRAICS